MPPEHYEAAVDARDRADHRGRLEKIVLAREVAGARPGRL